jgi:autotransporter-associated beta strand protein
LSRRTTNLTIGLLAVVIGASCFRPQLTLAASAYWDINGATPGAGGPNASGTWSLSAPTWTFDSLGTVAPTTGWVANDIAVFSAGNDATGNFNVTIDGNHVVSGFTFEEGNVLLEGAGVNLAGPAIIDVFSNAVGHFNITITGNSGLTKNGPGTLQLFGSNVWTGETIVNVGTLLGPIPGSISVNANGTLSGSHFVNGNLTSSGHVAPGFSPGITTVNGNYTQTNIGVLDIEVAGTVPGTQHDQLVVTGTASLDGVLRIVSEAPNAPGTTVHVLDGNRAGTRFFNVETVAGSEIYFAPEYLPNGVNAVSFTLGDMNRNGVRNAEDIAWFAKALTDPDGYWNSSATPQGGPACICIYGSSSGNMDGVSGLDFDDIDDFAAAVGVSAARVVEEIERLSAPEPKSSALVAMGFFGSAALGYRRGGRLSKIRLCRSSQTDCALDPVPQPYDFRH